MLLQWVDSANVRTSTVDSFLIQISDEQHRLATGELIVWVTFSQDCLLNM